LYNIGLIEEKAWSLKLSHVFMGFLLRANHCAFSGNLPFHHAFLFQKKIEQAHSQDAIPI